MLERATNRPRLLAANERMEIILEKRIEEVERERISRRDGLSGAIYRAWGCETGRALTLDDTFFFLPFSFLFSLFSFWEMDVELKKGILAGTVKRENRGEGNNGRT